MCRFIYVRIYLFVARPVLPSTRCRRPNVKVLVVVEVSANVAVDVGVTPDG